MKAASGRAASGRVSMETAPFTKSMDWTAACATTYEHKESQGHAERERGRERERERERRNKYEFSMGVRVSE